MRALFVFLGLPFSSRAFSNHLQEQTELTTSRRSCRTQRDETSDSLSLLQIATSLHTLTEGSDSTRDPSPIAGCEGFECIKAYVNLADSSYAWKDTGYRISGTGSMYDTVLGEAANAPRVAWTGYVLNMTSQRWMNNKVSNPLWWHTLVVIVPANRDSKDWATLDLDFGINFPNKVPSLTRIDNRWCPNCGLGDGVIEVDEHNLQDNLETIKAAAQKVAYLAVKTGAIAASLLNLPNGYEVFHDDPTNMQRSSDMLRSYTYNDFLRHPEHPEVLHELPIAKAVVRAMDTITAFSTTLGIWGDFDTVEKFAVSGYSKLGHATLVAGALDDRVRLIVPGSTALHMVPTGHLSPAGKSVGSDLHWATNLARPSKQEREDVIKTSIQADGEHWETGYLAMSAAGLANDPAALKMHSIIDPDQWLGRLTKPMFFQGGSSDQLVGEQMFSEIHDDLSAIPGPTSVNVVPNAEHDDALWEGLPSTAAFIKGGMQRKKAPRISEAYSPATKSLEVRQVSNHKPISVQRWLSFGEHRKCEDKQCLIWHDSSGLQESYPGSGTWRAVVEPELLNKTLGMFVTLTYAWPEPDSNFTMSSVVYSTSQTPLFREAAEAAGIEDAVRDLDKISEKVQSAGTEDAMRDLGSKLR